MGGGSAQMDAKMKTTGQTTRQPSHSTGSWHSFFWLRIASVDVGLHRLGPAERDYGLQDNGTTGRRRHGTTDHGLKLRSDLVRFTQMAGVLNRRQLTKRREAAGGQNHAGQNHEPEARDVQSPQSTAHSPQSAPRRLWGYFIRACVRKQCLQAFFEVPSVRSTVRRRAAGAESVRSPESNLLRQSTMEDRKSKVLSRQSGARGLGGEGMYPLFYPLTRQATIDMRVF